jgi:hypothetical protein
MDRGLPPREPRRAGFGATVGAPVCLAGRAGPEVSDDLVDHGRLRDEGDDPPGPATGRARKRADLEDLLQERRPPGGGLGGRESWREASGGPLAAEAGVSRQRQASLLSHSPSSLIPLLQRGKLGRLERRRDAQRFDARHMRV